MRLIVDRIFDFKTRRFEYIPSLYTYSTLKGYTINTEKFFKIPEYIVTNSDKEVAKIVLDTTNGRAWNCFSYHFKILPFRKLTFNVQTKGGQTVLLQYSGESCSMQLNGNTYSIYGHSNCVVSLWENNTQIGIVKKNKDSTVRRKGFEQIEILYNDVLSEELMFLLSIFGWEEFVGTVDANRTITTVYFGGKAVDVNWKPEK